jgi:hypothetical protein|tara:strand:- start:4155 stop:4433 length:279 start_codon:yes stop_codon:yes gene_type:complete
MSNLYYLKYHQENEVYIEADSEEEAQEKIEAYTSNGGENMYNVRLNECSWRVERTFSDIKSVEIKDNFQHTHATSDGSEWIETDIPDGYYEW